MTDIDTSEEDEPNRQPYPFDDEWDDDDNVEDDQCYCDHQWIDAGTYEWCLWCGAVDYY